MEENTNKLFRLVVNFVYDELLNQFIKSYGDCKSSTFCLINWDVLVNNRNSDIYGKLETKIVYKCYVSYLVNLFSKYITTGESTFLLEIQKILYDENLIFSIPFSFSITHDLKITCFKIMAFVVMRHPYDKNYQEFKNLLDSQDLIATGYYKDYSNEVLFMELCSIFKKDKYLNEKPVLKTLVKNIDDISENNTAEGDDYSNSYLHCAENLCTYADDEITKKKNESVFTQNVSTPDREDFARNHSFYPRSSNFNSQVDYIELDEEDGKSNEEFQVSRSNIMAYNDEFSHITYKNELSSSDDDSNRYKPPSDKRYSYDFNNNNNKVNKYNKWDEREAIYLVYFAEKLGRTWLEISTKYRKYFQNRSANDLAVKYTRIEKNKRLLEYYKKQSEAFEGIENIDTKFKKNDKKVVYKWTQSEVLTLINGVEKYGKNWNDILTNARSNFRPERKSKDLCCKYYFLKKNEENFNELKKKAVLMPPI